MFSNRHRSIKIASLLILIILAGLYSHFLSLSEITARDYVKNPEIYDNQTLFVKRDGRILEVGKGYLDVFIDGEEFRLYKEFPGARKGESISGEFIFHKDGNLEIKQLHIHFYRDIKLALSIPAALIVFLLLFKTYRLNRKKLVLEER